MSPVWLMNVNYRRTARGICTRPGTFCDLAAQPRHARIDPAPDDSAAEIKNHRAGDGYCCADWSWVGRRTAACGGDVAFGGLCAGAAAGGAVAAAAVVRGLGACSG